MLTVMFLNLTNEILLIEDRYVSLKVFVQISCVEGFFSAWGFCLHEKMVRELFFRKAKWIVVLNIEVAVSKIVTSRMAASREL